MATLDLSDPSFRPQRLHKSGFFKLPRELRDIIYAYVLVEPYYFDRRHSAFCNESDRSCVNPETPPFSVTCLSRCNRRRGLGLLQANRQIDDEAAPIFWGRNMLCFRSPSEFSKNVGNGLRKQCREYIRHLHVGSQVLSYPDSAKKIAMWETLLLCENLRTLELNPVLLKTVYHRFYSGLRSNLRHLNSLAMTQIPRYECQPAHTSNRYGIWVKITKNTLLDHSESQLDNAIRNFETNHIIHVNYHVNQYFLHSQPFPRSIPQLDPHLKDNNSVQTVTLRDGNVVDLPIYGLPNSADTRLQHSRQRMFEQNRRKAAGLPSLEEVKLAERVEELKEIKQERLKTEEEDERERQREEKKLEQEKFREEQEAAESKNRKNQRTHKQRKLRKAEKTKKEERKRVPKLS